MIDEAEDNGGNEKEKKDFFGALRGTGKFSEEDRLEGRELTPEIVTKALVAIQGAYQENPRLFIDLTKEQHTNHELGFRINSHYTTSDWKLQSVEMPERARLNKVDVRITPTGGLI